MSQVVLHVGRGREWRGGEQQVLLLVRTLATRASFSQLVITGRGTRLEQELLAATLPVAGIPWGRAWDPRALRALSRQVHALRRDGRQPILHAHDSHALGIALLAGWWHHIPVIATRRSVLPPGALWQRPACVIAISHAVADSLGKSGVPPERIRIIPSAAPGEWDEGDMSDARPNSSTRLLAVGALTPEKGHATLIRALALLGRPDLRLTICGEGAEQRSLERLAGREGVAAQVRFKPTVDPDDFRQATLFIQPSLREALGTAVLRAMAAGVPVVASRTGGLVELLEGGAGTLVAPSQPALLAEAMATVLGDPAARERLSRAARRRVADYRPARMADQVADVYASFLCKP